MIFFYIFVIIYIENQEEKEQNENYDVFQNVTFCIVVSTICNVFKCEDVIVLAGYAFMLILYTLDLEEYMG